MPQFRNFLLFISNLSSITLFQEHAKEVGEEVIEAADIEADEKRSNENNSGEFGGFLTSRPRYFG